jgi:hypothetical protein
MCPMKGRSAFTLPERNCLGTTYKEVFIMKMTRQKGFRMPMIRDSVGG